MWTPKSNLAQAVTFLAIFLFVWLYGPWALLALWTAANGAGLVAVGHFRRQKMPSN